ncbi:hypothetical protein E1267_33375 [Nonomuraea longispora]|uniref:Uncharacterized protein n=1 Tax=Nonomuraea longispora TaxID=1848320 RepID=A0A4R4MXC0_9ACTN|nr:hypothetical protein [Nonomuraea longispora]TDC00898.1 hypothetical protein E1267_33375 [Nonomuraea longispora]
MSELPEGTGDERVDAIVAGLGRLGEQPASEHVAIFDEAFSGLESVLAAVDDSGGQAPDGQALAGRHVAGGHVMGGQGAGERPAGQR